MEPGGAGMTLRTVQQYRALAAEPGQREALLRDGTVAQFLAYVLEDRDEEIVTGALDTLLLLCESEPGRRQLRLTYGLVPALECLQMKDSSEEVVRRVRRALEQLRERRGLEAAVGPEEPAAPLPPPARARHRVVTLHVTGLVTDDDRRRLEAALVRVRGVVSIAVDLARGRCTCRVRDQVTVGALAAAVDRAEPMAAYQVVRAPGGEEELVPVSRRAREADRPAPDRPAPDRLPEYLPEEEPAEEPGEGAVAPEGFFKQASSWLSSASSFLSQSFYW